MAGSKMKAMGWRSVLAAVPLAMAIGAGFSLPTAADPNDPEADRKNTRLNSSH